MIVWPSARNAHPSDLTARIESLYLVSIDLELSRASVRDSKDNLREFSNLVISSTRLY